MQRNTLFAYLYLLIANICFGLNSPFSMALFISDDPTIQISAFAMSSFRVIGAALLFWLFSFIVPSRERVAPKDLFLILLASLFGVQLNQFLYLWGMSLTSSIDAPIIAATVPIITMVMAMFAFREPITPLKVGGVLMGAIGAVVLIISGSKVQNWDFGMIEGYVICFLAAISYSAYLTFFKGVITKYSPITTMKWMFLYSAIVASILFKDDILAVKYTQMPIRCWFNIGFVVVLGTFVSFLFVLKAQSVVRPTVVSMFNYTQPIAATLFSVWVGLVTFSWLKVGAMMAIFLGVWMVTRSKARVN
ncbi:MAG: DMT family transporter [Rikenellaceae bacterium]